MRQGAKYHRKRCRRLKAKLCRARDGYYSSRSKYSKVCPLCSKRSGPKPKGYDEDEET